MRKPKTIYADREPRVDTMARSKRKARVYARGRSAEIAQMQRDVRRALRRWSRLESVFRDDAIANLRQAADDLSKAERCWQKLMALDSRGYVERVTYAGSLVVHVWNASERVARAETYETQALRGKAKSLHNLKRKPALTDEQIRDTLARYPLRKQQAVVLGVTPDYLRRRLKALRSK